MRKKMLTSLLIFFCSATGFASSDPCEKAAGIALKQTVQEPFEFSEFACITRGSKDQRYRARVSLKLPHQTEPTELEATFYASYFTCDDLRLIELRDTEGRIYFEDSSGPR